MSVEKQQLRLGTFVLGGAALLLFLLFFLGLSDIFVRKAQLATFFTESVQGLSTGSAVKYRGVPVGTVSNISILTDAKQVRVDMEIDLQRFHDPAKKGVDEAEEFRRFLQSELRQGLRCRLEFLGITGMKYIDFDYFGKPTETAPQPPVPITQHNVVYIASVPSSFKDVTAVMTQALERISKIRFEEIAGEMERTLREATNLLSDPALKSMIDRINESARNFEIRTRNISRVMDEENLNRINRLVEKNLTDFSVLTGNLNRDIKAMRLPESTAALRDSAEAVSSSRDEISNALLKLNAALEAFRELCETMNRDPSSLLHGRRFEKNAL